MRIAIYRSVSMMLAAVFVLSGLITGTLGWQSLGQQAKTRQSQLIAYADVELTKLERDTEGNETITPVPGAAFSIFTSDGEPLGGRYITDEKGKIAVQLPAGSYYFEEIAPSTGFTFDTDKTGQRIIRYPFTVTGEKRSLSWSPPATSGCKGRSRCKRSSRTRTIPR
ncbi:MAG: collagen binding domain-containing protein [Clostridia bacterium]